MWTRAIIRLFPLGDVSASESQNLWHHLSAGRRLSAWVIASGQIGHNALTDAKILGYRFGLIQSIVPKEFSFHPVDLGFKECAKTRW